MTFKKVILINTASALLYGVIICPIIAVIFYTASGTGPASAGSGFMEGLYPALRFSLITGFIFGSIFAAVLAFLLRPFSSIIIFRDKDNLLRSLNIAVSRINYKLYKHDDDFFIFKENKNRLAEITVRLKNRKAIIYGHFNKVKYLKKNLPGCS